MELTAKLDEYGKPAWIAVMIAGFIIFWPIGLGILAYLIWSGRMGCSKKNKAGRWHNERQPKKSATGEWWSRHSKPPSSGNHAFDEYRDETLRRLEAEQKEFTDFLEQLRDAKDKAEFDQFMAARKRQADKPASEGSVPSTATDKPDDQSPYPVT